MKSWVEIAAQRLAENYRLLVDTAGCGNSVLAVVKADAYGHGAELCAPVLAAAGAPWLGVTDAAEGSAVRAALLSKGIAIEQQPQVLVMSEALDEDADLTVHRRLTPVISSVAQMETLSRATSVHGVLPFGVHLEVDTGMARQGVPTGEPLDRVLRWLAAQDAIRLDGVMTHFASAEIAGSRQTAGQRLRFEQAIRQVKAAGLTPAWVHAGNSSTIDNPVEAEAAGCWLNRIAAGVRARPMVRSGLALYGYSLPVEREEGYAGVAQSTLHSRLQPVMTWKTRVTGLREIEAGTRVGYNGTFTAARPMRVALLPVGYADGLRRELSCSDQHPGGWVSLAGIRAPIVGRVSMNLTTVDVTGATSVAVGNEAVILGEGITAEDHARLAGTIPYEILCGVRGSRCLQP